MTRRSFNLNPPYREIEYSDRKKEFWNRLTPRNQINLSYLVDVNIGDRYVIVYEIDGKILGFMTFLDQGDHLHLDLIERNELIERWALFSSKNNLISKHILDTSWIDTAGNTVVVHCS